jgi:Transglycosylase SLT domain
MRPFWRAAGLLAALVAYPGHAQTIVPASGAQGVLCRSAVAAAERSSDIPAQLLAAISQVESGRRDPLTGATHPWPWTVNAEGQGYFFDTKAEAIAAVTAMQARGVRSIDVGCGQINLMHHPNAFTSLDVAFNPQANATYAAHFLRELFIRTGDWNKAAAAYHSATPELGAAYQQKVLAAWPAEQRQAGPAAPTALARAWAATMTAPPPGFVRIVRGQTPTAAQGARLIMLPAVAGRALDPYRTQAVGLVYQPPRRTGG